MMVYGFRLTLLGETQFFFPRIMIPQRVKEIHGFLEQTLHLDAAHLILTREGYGKAGSCTMEAAWIYGGSRHRKKVLETG